jgi:hypothetical protein
MASGVLADSINPECSDASSQLTDVVLCQKTGTPDINIEKAGYSRRTVS